MKKASFPEVCDVKVTRHHNIVVAMNKIDDRQEEELLANLRSENNRSCTWYDKLGKIKTQTLMSRLTEYNPHTS